MKPEVKGILPSQTQEINALFWSFLDYRWDEKQEQKLRASLYKCILPIVGKDRFTKLTDDLLRLRRE